jgi:hypothetical protein
VAGPVGEELVNAFALPLALDRLRAAGVRVLEGFELAEMTSHGVRLRHRYDGSHVEVEAPLVVHAARRHAVDGLVGELRERGIRAVAVGDAVAPRQVADAIRDGHDSVARSRMYI